MAQNSTTEVVLPAASFAALRRSLVEQMGAEEAARALQRAGHAAGDAFYALLTSQLEGGEGPADLGTGAFWRRLGDLLAARGWGHIGPVETVVGVGALASSNWAEADAGEFAGRPSCFFTTGLLANILGHVAGRDVGVFEVSCRSNGDEECRFLFGGQGALQGVYESLSSGADVDTALASLG